MLQKEFVKKRGISLLPGSKALARDGLLFLFFGAVGAATLPDGLSPFPAAAAAAAWCCSLPLAAVLGVLAGAAVRRSWYALISCAACLAGAWAFRQLSGKVYRRQVLLALGCGQLLELLLRRPADGYAWIMALLSAAACPLLATIFTGGMKVALTLRARKLLAEDEILSLGVLGGCALLGLTGFEQIGTAAAGVLAAGMTALMGYTGGSGIGAACGAALGVMMAVGGQGQYMGLLALCGAAAGSMRRLKKAGAAAGALIASAVYLLYTREHLMLLAVVALGCGVFALLPEEIAREVGRFVSAPMRRERSRKEYLTRLRTMSSERLHEFSQVFGQMGSIFSQPLESQPPQDWDIGALKPLCGECAARGRCWSDPEKLRTEMEQILRSDLPSFRLERCPHLPQLKRCAQALCAAREREELLQKQGESWARMAGEQLQGVAAVVDAMAQKLEKDVRYDELLEARIMRELDQAGLGVRDVSAQIAGGRLRISVEGRGCARQCKKEALKIVARCCGKRMRLASRRCDGMCRTLYEEACALEVYAGVAQQGKEEEEIGDSVLCCDLPEGRYLCALSDGMGFGKEAAGESKITVELLEKLYHAGIDRQSAMQTVNKLLLLRAKEEMYSTADVCCIDLVSGEAEISKLSAAPSVHIGMEGARLLEGGALPAGILEQACPRNLQLKLKAGDWLLMFSDGVTDALGEELLSACARYACGDPGGAARCLLELALERGADDDLSVVALRLEDGMEFLPQAAKG